jgi:hypothetical protein
MLGVITASKSRAPVGYCRAIRWCRVAGVDICLRDFNVEAFLNVEALP